MSAQVRYFPQMTYHLKSMDLFLKIQFSNKDIQQNVLYYYTMIQTFHGALHEFLFHR